MGMGKEMEDRDCLAYSNLIINLVLNFSFIWWLLKEPFLPGSGKRSPIYFCQFFEN